MVAVPSLYRSQSKWLVTNEVLANGLRGNIFFAGWNQPIDATIIDPNFPTRTSL